MKKLLSLMLLGSLLAFCACTDEDEGGTTGDTAKVTFTLETTSGLSTRAYSDGLTATYLVYGVYDSETEELVEGISQTTAVEKFSEKQATVELNLPKGSSYTIIFWAQAAEPPYTVDLKNKTVTLNGETDEDGNMTVAGNDETMDAFYAKVETGTVTGNYSESITLKRPFAQVNVGSDDLTAYRNAGKDVKYTKMVITGAGNTLDLFTGEVTYDGSTTGGVVVYDWAEFDESNSYPYEKETDEEGNVITPTTKDSAYSYIAMNYVFASEDMATVDVDFWFSETKEEEDYHSVSVPSVSIQRNYQTNLYGSLLTETFTYKLVIDKEFDGEFNNQISVSSSEELIAALNAGYGATLTADIEEDYYTTVVSSDAIIDLNGHTLTFSNSTSRIQVQDEAELTITGGTIEASYWAVVVNAKANVTLDNVDIESTGPYGTYMTANADGSTVTVENSSIEAASYAVYILSSASDVTFEATGSTISTTGTYSRAITSSAANTTITLTEDTLDADYLGVYASGNGTTITATDVTVVETAHSAYYVDADSATVTVDGGSVSDAYYYGIVTWSDYNTVSVTGTTFTNCGYDAVALLGDNSTLEVDDCVITATKDLGAFGILIGVSSGTTTGNTATITGTTIDVSNQTYGVGLQVYGYDNEVIIEDCIINHNYFGITQNGTSTPGSTFTVKNSTITGPYTGIYLSMSTTSEYYNTLTVSDNSKIVSEESSAIEVKKTNITVSSSTLQSDYDTQQDYSLYGSGSSGEGYGIVLAGYTAGKAYEGTILLTDVTYTLAAGTDMNGATPPWYVLHYDGTTEDSEDGTDSSSKYENDGATDSSSYGSSASSARKHNAPAHSWQPQTKTRDIKAKQINRNKLITL